MNVRDGPVRVMAKRVDGFDRKHRTFKCRHAVESDSDDKELQYWVGCNLVPRLREVSADR